MTIRNFEKPAQRTNLITNVSWQGDDDDLALEVTFDNGEGGTSVVSFSTTNASNGVGQICLENTIPVTDLTDNVILASLRMGSLISGNPPGSKEWVDAMGVDQTTKDFQMGLKTNVYIKAHRIISENVIELDIKRRNDAAQKTVTLGFDDLSSYSVAPDTQIYCIVGAIEKEFPSYVHDHPTTVLTQTQKDDIVTYVSGLTLWV